MRLGSVLITGGTGFLGHGLVRHYLTGDEDGRICIYSRSEHAQAAMASAHRDERLRFFVGDVRDAERLERAMQRIDTVIHAAALKRIEVGHYNPDEMVKTNELGSMNVIEAARKARVRQVVLVSSDKAYQPVSPYGLSKATAENLFLGANRMNLGPRFRVVRYGNVAGSTGSVIPIWREQLRRGREVTVTDPDCTRFWMRRDQAVALVVSATFEGAPELQVPDLPAFRLGDLAEAMGATIMKRTGLGPWEKKHETMAPGNSSDTARRMEVDEITKELELLERMG